MIREETLHRFWWALGGAWALWIPTSALALTFGPWLWPEPGNWPALILLAIPLGGGLGYAAARRPVRAWPWDWIVPCVAVAVSLLAVVLSLIAVVTS